MLFLIVADLVALIAAWQDFRTGRISNRLTYAVLASGPVLHAAFAWSLSASGRQIATAAGFSVLGAVACGLLPFIMWWKGAVGGGDVKLFAALGAVLEPFLGFEAQLYAYYVAALFFPLGLLYRGAFWATLKSSFVALTNAFRPAAQRVPLQSERTWFRLGPAVLAGCLMTTLLHWR